MLFNAIYILITNGSQHMWDGYNLENHRPNSTAPMICVLVSGSKPMAFDLWTVLSQSPFDILRSIKVSRGKCGNCTKVREQT